MSSFLSQLSGAAFCMLLDPSMNLESPLLYITTLPYVILAPAASVRISKSLGGLMGKHAMGVI